MSATQLNLVKSMTVDSNTEKGPDDLENISKPHTGSIRGRPSEKIQLSRIEHNKKDSIVQ